MSNRKGDDSKRPADCLKGQRLRCKNMKETGGGMDGEQYNCEVCGEAIYLDYDEMR